MPPPTQKSIIKKPFVTALVVLLIIFAIVYFQQQRSPSSSSSPGSLSEKTVNEKDEKASRYSQAPDFAGIAHWINTEPLTMAQLRGKVVLVDFWTYTCINCLRTLPYLKMWHEKYHDQGLVIVGVHTPEFEFEKTYDNVLKFVNEHQIKYPVAQDNEYATWTAYHNRNWPHEYLIDSDGYIRHDHIGEGNYEETEARIQQLLSERMIELNQTMKPNMTIQKPEAVVDVDFYNVYTPEIYLGYQTTRGNLGFLEHIQPDVVVNYTSSRVPIINQVSLEGLWKNNPDNVELAGDEGTVVLVFKAKVANIVAGSEQGSNLVVSLDNKVEDLTNKGADVVVSNSSGSISSARVAFVHDFKLYNVAAAPDYGTSTLKLHVVGKGFKLYTFTFG